MSHLRADPSIEIRDVAHLHALAAGFSAQAIALYRGLAERMRGFGNEPAARAFALCEAGARARSGSESAGEAPAILDDEGLGQSRLVTPYAAFSVAVRNAERVFDFWTYARAHAGDPAVAVEAEGLAQAELHQIGRLRRERRRAFHAERAGQPRPAALAASASEFRAEASAREAALAALHRRISRALRPTHPEPAALVAFLAEGEEALARRLGAAAAEPGASEPLPARPDALRALAAARLEALVEHYLQAAEQSQDEAIVDEAQRLAHAAIGRLARLR